MEKTMTLEQLVNFLNALIHSFTTVGLKRAVSPQFRYSDLGASGFILYSASIGTEGHIQMCAKNSDTLITLYTNSLKFTVTETEYDKDSYQYRLDAGNDIYILIRANRVEDTRTPLEKFTSP